ncbi:uncharacterized protein SOCE26_045310 [Sorangium cellulosum]|uniref:PatA-like N-terminal domain-containing protein n=1 Tax=Sorangium cellulosum TaxID=56 RepID=A0A2L0EUX1_SORCE|nr:DUF4388 domain-containing protein [Sorangium cellulosum]AUX43091.1 uncharacterized protein SOCE26_045310 [Sorangium cellulosum]
MSEERNSLVRIDATGTAHPLDLRSSKLLRARQGMFELLPAPEHLVVMRHVGKEVAGDAETGAALRLAGQITGPGALCDVVALVGQAGWSGELVAVDGAARRSLFFEPGHAVGARSSVEGERIGEVLYRYGALSRAQIYETLAATAPDARFGEVAVKRGLVPRERLYQLLSKQAEEIAYQVLLASEGMFYFLDRFDEEQIASRQNLPVHALLMEGVRRMDELRYFRERIPSDQHVPARVPDRGPPPGELRAVYDAIDGQRSVAELSRATGQGEFETTRALFQLVQSGRVVVRAPGPTGAAGSIALFNEAIASILSAVDGAQRGDEVRWQLASFAAGVGVYDTLFRGAGPAADGTFDAEKLVENATLIAGAAKAEAMLSQWLYEYTSFAMFVAEPCLRLSPEGAPLSKRSDNQPPLSKRVAELVGPLAHK